MHELSHYLQCMTANSLLQKKNDRAINQQTTEDGSGKKRWEFAEELLM